MKSEILNPESEIKTKAEGRRPEAGVIDFHPWQRRAFDDYSRVQVDVWHRQAGKDFCASAVAVDDAFRTGRPWFITSLTQRQSDSTGDKCRQIADIFKRVSKIHGRIKYDVEEYQEYDKNIDHWFNCQAHKISLPGGGMVTSLPGRDPDTLAGLTGNVIFTEFGLFPNGGYEHWRVVFPLITRGYRVIVITTPRGKNTKLFELYSDPQTYSVHFQPITRSVEEGFVLRDNKGEPCTLAEFEKLYGDPAGWRREYLCEFTGDLESLVKWAQLAAAAQDGPFRLVEIKNGAGFEAGKLASFLRMTAAGGGRHEVGWDIARRGDLSAVWVNRATPGQPKQLRALVVMANTDFALQRHVLCEIMDADRLAVGAGDATGLGMDSNETLSARYGPRWQGVTFTSATKRQIGSAIRTAFDDGDQRVPDVNGPHKFIATDIYAVQTETGGENLKLIESDNPLLPDSHCDIAYAMGLARLAGGMKWAAMDLWTA